MRKILWLCMVLGIIGTGNVWADDIGVGDTQVGLHVNDMVELVIIDGDEVVTPGPEDYARDLQVERIVNDPQRTTGGGNTGVIANNTGNEAAHDNAMYDANNDIGKGFAERSNCFEMTIFSNSQDGAALYVHGLQPSTQQNILRLEDTYLSVNTEMTYILRNDIEGAYANACNLGVSQDGVLGGNPAYAASAITAVNAAITTLTALNYQAAINAVGFASNTFKQMLMDADIGAYPGSRVAALNQVLAGLQVLASTVSVIDNPRAGMGLDDFPTALKQNLGSKDPTNSAYSTWLRIHNESQHIFEVKMATASVRSIHFNLGIANLARYAKGDYTNTLTFTLMPIVG